jgi:hypothetical protein
MRGNLKAAFLVLALSIAFNSNAHLRVEEPDWCIDEWAQPTDIPPASCQWTYAGSTCSQNCTELCSGWYEDSTGQQTGCTHVSPNVLQLCSCYLDDNR